MSEIDIQYDEINDGTNSLQLPYGDPYIKGYEDEDGKECDENGKSINEND